MREQVIEISVKVSVNNALLSEQDMARVLNEFQGRAEQGMDVALEMLNMLGIEVESTLIGSDAKVVGERDTETGMVFVGQDVDPFDGFVYPAM
jgi:translation initiation factor IF-3